MGLFAHTEPQPEGEGHLLGPSETLIQPPASSCPKRGCTQINVVSQADVAVGFISPVHHELVLGLFHHFTSLFLCFRGKIWKVSYSDTLPHGRAAAQVFPPPASPKAAISNSLWSFEHKQNSHYLTHPKPSWWLSIAGSTSLSTMKYINKMSSAGKAGHNKGLLLTGAPPRQEHSNLHLLASQLKMLLPQGRVLLLLGALCLALSCPRRAWMLSYNTPQDFSGHAS